MATYTAMAQGHDAEMRSSFEQRVGILHLVSSKECGWHGQLRTRFTDFQVNEIAKDGTVIHLENFYNNAGEMRRVQNAQKTNSVSTVDQSLKPAKPDTTTGGNAEASGTSGNPASAVTQTVDGQSEEADISESDQSALSDLVGQATAKELMALNDKRKKDPKANPKSLGFVKISAMSNKSQRSRVHSEIRRIFNGKLDTLTDSDGSIKASVMSGGNQQGPRSRNEPKRGGRSDAFPGTGPFLHFSMYKENKDTIDALQNITRLIRLQKNSFGTAGTKDRRAATVQRVSIKIKNPASLLVVNDKIPNIKIGDFRYEQYPILLGSHAGNEFTIILKNCIFQGTDGLELEQKLNVAQSALDTALGQLSQHGFINYFGTQRFGTHAIGTQEIGKKILKGDFEDAVRALLSFDPSLADKDPEQAHVYQQADISRARACSVYLEKADAASALDQMPSRFFIERSMLRFLSKQPKDFLGALNAISRTMRTMYVHAYQSLVWNFAASQRWEMFGPKVVKGDLILVESDSDAVKKEAVREEVAEEDIHLLEGDDSVDAPAPGMTVHTLTEDEANSGKYSIFDIVLPSPGWDVTYPSNEIGQFYTDFMAKVENGGLNPHDMRRGQRDFSLPGAYRKLMGRTIGTASATAQVYRNDKEQLVPTDLDRIRSRKAQEASLRATRTAEMGRQAADRDGGSNRASSAWHNFAQNVQQTEADESRQRVARRKAEEMSPAPEVRLNDTWVQTSADAGAKRVKMTTHKDSTSVAGAAIPETTGDAMQVDSVTGDQDVSGSGMGESLNEQAKVASPTHQDRNSQQVSTSIFTIIKRGVRTIASRIVHAFSWILSARRRITDMDLGKPTPGIDGQAGNSTETPAELTGSDAVERSSKPTDGVATDPQKIAVILRCSLNSSQYATVVIRELQGAFQASTAPANMDAPVPSEEVATSV
ncbi:pseudouridine synthase [Xylariomycetidae sp. FL0641]|nr:pseudouridine synthase [Xylariomycetidae sp. FL0641]